MDRARVDASLGLALDGYRFISRRCERLGRDVFETRLGLRPVICMRGMAAGGVFYSDRLQRAGAMPRRIRKTLFGDGGVQGLDGRAHHHRKALFMQMVASSEAIDALTAGMQREWDSAIERWQRDGERVVLCDEVGPMLCRAVLGWAGVPFTDHEIPARTAQLHALIDSPARFGPRHWAGRIARKRADRWAGQLIQDVRDGVLSPPAGQALHTIAVHRDEDGQPLPPPVASVELLNVLRPAVAIDRFLVFTATALAQHPEWRDRLRDDDAAAERFVQEVRRLYPFFPVVAATVRAAFDWQGTHFPAGRMVLYDLYGTNRDPHLWRDAETFDPDRFDGTAMDPVAQGGGDHQHGHRCPGEWITIEQMKLAVRILTRRMHYTVPAQDLRINHRRFPTQPNSGVILDNVQRAALSERW